MKLKNNNNNSTELTLPECAVTDILKVKNLLKFITNSMVEEKIKYIDVRQFGQLSKEELEQAIFVLHALAFAQD